TIAVEIHQNAGTSSDLSFDLEFNTTAANPGGGSVQLIRGPYLQMANENSVVLRWRTDVATTSKVKVGLPNGIFADSVVSSALNTDHVVRIAGLLPDTRYSYAIGNANVILQSGIDNYFRTAPPANTSRRMAFSVFGDCGRDQNSFRTLSLQSYLNNTTSNRADLMLLLGDNAYNLGTDEEYQAEFFTPYGSNILKNHVLFPAPGNHDYANNSLGVQGDVAFSYYRNFTVPTNAECGGVASGTKAYYSYNWGNVHFLSLDSYGRETNNQYRLYDTTSAQVQWIKNDLAANTRPWVVVYWHHPPFTMGSHNSDNEAELVSMRENLLTILERYGVDLILCGHSHNYERSYLLKNHYGFESTFNSNLHTVSTSSAKYDGSVNSCPYVVSDLKEKHGTVYVVSGSSGADGGTQLSFPHDAMPFSIDDGGMFYFEVEGNRLDAKFLHRNGTVADRFTIMKSVGKNITQTINKGSSATLTASWVGNYLWSNGATTRSISVSPPASSSYSVTDGSNCIADQFQVNVTNIVSNQTDSSGLMLQVTDGGAVVDLKFGRSRFQLTDSIVIVGLGSSTMSGTGASSWSKSFPGKLQSWLNTFNGKFVNLSTAGYNTTNVLPWGSSVNVKVQQNITSALSIRPDAIIIGLPTNDISAGLTPQQFRDNIMKLFRYAAYSGIPCFIMSPNPRDDFSNARKQDLSISNQLFQDSIPEQFLINTFNLLRDSLSSDPAKINPLFANGDLIHFNDSGHAVITQQVINKLDAYFQNMTGKVSLIQVEQGVVPDSASTPSSWQVLDQITDVTITEKKYPRLNNLWNAYRFRIQYSNGYTSPYSRMAYLKQSFARDSIDQVLPVDFAPVGSVKTNNRWNKFYFTSTIGSSIALTDTLGNATVATLSLTKPFTASSTLGTTSGLAYPSEVSSDGWNVSTSSTAWSQLQFNNLDRNYAYELEFLGSYSFYDPTFFLGVWANGTDCNGSPMNLAANLANTYRKGIIRGLVPDANNSITLDLYALGSQVSINGLILRRYRNKVQPVAQKIGVMAKIKPMVGNSFSADHDFYPNPVRQGSSFTINTNDKGSILCLLYSQEGKVLLKRKFEFTTQLSTVGLKPGMYMLHIISSQRTTTQKLIIQ
ncbi:MAG: hypothetical protein RLZZ172_492, partial [Bacteroidota bacterium]